MTTTEVQGGSGGVNLARMIEGHEADRTALICRNVETTYGELRELVGRLRGGLAAHGVGHGDRVAIISGNDRDFVISYLATLGLGAIAVPLNPMSPPPELEHELATVEPVAVIVGSAGDHSWDGVDRAAIPFVRTVVIAGEAGPGEGAVDLADLLASEPVPIVDVEPDHLAALMFTSGTAGPPRAAMLSHHNLLSNIEQDLTARDHIDSRDLVYGVLPLFHIFGLNVLLGVSLTVGASVLLVQRFDPLSAAESIQRRRITVVPGAPPIWISFAAFDDLPDDTFSSVRLAVSGAARLPTRTADQFAERFGVEISEGYGLTEASPVVTSSSGAPRRAGSVGHVLVGQQLRVVGYDGHDVPVGDAGEIWIKGPNVFQGYWNEPEATARVLQDGWLRTGDIGTIDADGYLYLVDRAKDLIIVSGFNVFPAEVEEVLRMHPAVAEAGVLGIPHPHHGEAVKAYVVLAEGHVADEDTLIEHAHDHLARYKCPTKVMFVDALPRNGAGKLIRRELEGTVLAD